MVAEPSLLEVTLRERPTGAGLQVTLESHRAPLIRELDDHMTMPHASTRGMETAPSVVFRESPVRIRCEARIETGPVIGIPEYVEEVFATITVHDGEMVSKHDAPTTAGYHAQLWAGADPAWQMVRTSRIAAFRQFSVHPSVLACESCVDRLACRAEARSRTVTGPPSRREATLRRGSVRLHS